MTASLAGLGVGQEVVYGCGRCCRGVEKTGCRFSPEWRRGMAAGWSPQRGVAVLRMDCVRVEGGFLPSQEQEGGIGGGRFLSTRFPGCAALRLE